MKHRESKNFVKNNVNKAMNDMLPPKQAAAADASIAGKNKNYGKVPSYLKKYNDAREEE